MSFSTGRAERAEREAFWRELISRRDTLNLTVAEVCRQAGVSTASFFQWQQKLRKARRRVGRRSVGQKTAVQKTMPSTDRSTASNTANAATPPLLPVRIVEDQVTEMTLEFPHGLRLRIPRGCDAATLQQVLRAALSAAREEHSC